MLTLVYTSFHVSFNVSPVGTFKLAKLSNAGRYDYQTYANMLALVYTSFHVSLNMSQVDTFKLAKLSNAGC